MRLHRLEMQAFGPFGTRVRVDFDPLNAHGVFLLSGPTGAGKTSLLDGIVFALYGQVPGPRNTARQLRSDHADPQVPPGVELEVTLRGHRLRIERSPAWKRPKRLGSGTTEQRASVHVQEWLGGEWVTRATRHEEAGLLLRDLIGMSLQQFCQVVLLPQGDFARLLTADADARGALLEQLFDARVYSDAERWLVEHRKECRQRLQAIENDLDRLRTRILEVTEERAPQMLKPLEADSIDGDRLLELLDEAAAVGEAALRVAVLVDAQATHEHTDAARAFDSASEASQRRGRYLQHRRRLADLQEQAPQKESWERAVAAAQRASQVAARLEVTDDARSAAAAAHTAHAAAQEQLVGLLPDTPVTDLASLVVEAHNELVRVEDCRPLQERAQAVGNEVAQLAQRERARRDVLATVQGQLHEVVQRAIALHDERGRLGVVAADLGSALAMEATAQAVWAAAEEYERLAAACADAEEEERRRHVSLLAARERLLGLRQARIEGMAGELAKGLNEGFPCPVCGSDSHPRPAQGESASPSAEQEQEAADRVADAEVAWQTAGRHLADVHANARNAQARCGDMPPQSARDLLDAAQSRAQIASSASERIEQINDELDSLRRADAEAAAELAQLREHTAADHARTATLLQEARLLEDEMRSRLGDATDYPAAVAAATARLRALDLAMQAEQTYQRSLRHLDHAEQVLRRAVVEAGFTSEAEVRAGIMQPTEVADLQARLRTYDAAVAAAERVLAEPDLQSLAEQEGPPLDALNTQLLETARARDLAHTRLADARRVHGRLGELATELTTLVAAWRPAVAEHRMATDLSQHAEGRAGARMRLVAYVLAERLEQVVAAATQRLDRMSGGRYALTHTEKAGAGDLRGGLGLRVVDAWTGRDRDPATLSGGETFLTSLALALGLTDVVCAEAGLIEVSTLFIDEGFASLDAETLDEVMDSIDGLRAGGRVVGIVSHLPAVADRVAAKIIVGKASAGSTVSQSPSATTDAVKQAVA